MLFLYISVYKYEEKKKKGAKYTNSGTVELMNIRIEKVYTFLDYVRGG